jgi:hypothetical protein
MSLSYTLMHCCVICCHKSQLQGNVVTGYFHCHGDSTLQRWFPLNFATIINLSHPLQTLPDSLEDPIPLGITGCDQDSRERTFEGQGL